MDYSSKVSSNGGGTPNSGVQIGIVTVTAAPNFSFAGYSNDGGNVQTPSNNGATGTFSVASNGRVTLTVGGTGNNQIPVFYLFSPGNAFSVSSGNGAIDPQTAGVSDKVGILALSSGNGTDTEDSNSQGTLSPNNASTGTYSVDSTGVFFLPASCVPGATTGIICEKIGAVVTGSKIVVMDANPSSAGGTTNPAVKVLDQ